MKLSNRLVCIVIAVVSFIGGLLLWNAYNELFIVAFMATLLFGSAAVADDSPIFKD